MSGMIYHHAQARADRRLGPPRTMPSASLRALCERIVVGQSDENRPHETLAG